MLRACLAIAVLMAACFALANSEDPVLREKRGVIGRWSAWRRWSTCSKKCGGGAQTRTRTCISSFRFKICLGSSKQTRKCNTRHCPVNGRWSAWRRWSTCSKKCGGGVQTRIRTCTNPSQSYGGKACQGSSRQLRRCNTRHCPVNGGWSRFGSWSSCSKKCGGGVRSRRRTCTKPSPSYGGKTCRGSSKLTWKCNKQRCPVNGGWSRFGSWSSCSKKCGGGVQSRRRTCTKPSPSYGGKTCPGSGKLTRKCNTQKCPVNGGWSKWGRWGRCSKTCGRGVQIRRRTCTLPRPAYGGKTCPGRGTASRTCTSCKTVNGGWTLWSKWNTCTATCGGGTKRRTRSCTNPRPSCCGKRCTGSSTHFLTCNTKTCPPVNGGWSKWGRWGRCSKTCGRGVQIRRRTCTLPRPAYGGKTCPGRGTTSRTCISCKTVNGGWTLWSKWNTCTATCGGGTKRRTRSCTNPRPSCCGKRCTGSSTHSLTCNTKTCPPATTRRPTSDAPVTDKCLKCICDVESKCKPLGCKMDVGSLSCGYYQIKWPYYIDCGKPGGNDKTDWKKCAKNKSCADKCVRNYMARYSQRCAGGKPVTCETHARIHNGGPRGCKKAATVAYWKKVEKCLK